MEAATITSSIEKGMKNVGIYCKYHGPQLKGAINMLRKYSDKLDWNKYERVMDIGCGPADMTCEYLLPFLPNDAIITAVDKSPEMIECARNHYGSNSRLEFDVMDIGNENQAKKYHQTFDMIFSSYCLHWLPDQRVMMENIFSMLKNGGDFIAFFVANPLYPLREEIIAMDKWKRYMSSIQVPHSHGKYPEETMNKLLRNVGFLVNECIIREVSYTFPSTDALLNTIYAIISMEFHLPSDFEEEFKSDYSKLMKNSKWYSFRADNSVVFTYLLYDIHCSKPQ